MKKSIIIADDNAGLVLSLKEFFENKGNYEVAGTAENGVQALALVERYNPDFLLLDIVMPELDGFGVLSAIKSRKPTVIMMSQLNTDGFVQKALRYGAKYFSQNRSTSTFCSKRWTNFREKKTILRSRVSPNPQNATALSTRESQTSLSRSAYPRT